MPSYRIEVPIGDLIEEDMRDYSKYVLEERHFPDFRDGLKPVQRRSLYTMFEDGILHTGKFKKCAAIVGNTIARYHPHGDTACYDALVGMTGEPSKGNKLLFIGPNWNYPTVEGYGNFGSIDGDKAAAMRYPEARLSALAQFLFNLKPCIEYTDNYMNDRKEPLYLPASLPFLLLNGISGIGVGLTTNIPTHNLEEVCGALIYMLKTDAPTLKGIMKYIKGPDWQYGGMLWDKSQIEEVYRTGKGTISWGLQTTVKDTKKGNYSITITGIPPVFKLNNFLAALQTGEFFKKHNINQKALKSIKKLNVSSELEVVIEVTDKLLLELIVGYKYTTQNKWNITVRNSMDDIQFASVNLLSYLKMWTNYCIKVHKKYFKLEIIRLIHEIKMDMLRIKIIENHTKIIDWIRKEQFGKIKSFLKCSDEDIEFIKRIMLGSFAKSNVDKIKERIADKHGQIKELRGNLENTKAYLIKYFTEAKKFSRRRTTTYLQ